MVREKNPNLELLVRVVDRLGELTDEMVLLGGCATGLLISDKAAPPIRETRDVDAIVRVGSLAAYHQLSKRLRAKGFKEDTSDGAPVCRWVAENIILDVMPTDPDILGFGNKWYAPAMQHAMTVVLPSGKSIRMVTAPYFLLTKLEAFAGRGKGDYQMSHDIEDMIAVLDGRPEIVEEVKRAASEVRNELANHVKRLLADNRFVDAISGHMPTDRMSQVRVAGIIKTLKELAAEA